MLKKSAVFIFLVAIALLLPLVVQAGDPICAKCGKAITEGNYIQADGKYYHPEHFVCAKCGRAIGDQPYYPRDGKIYDKACYTDLFVDKCASCGKPIEGEYVIKDNLKYDKECFASGVAEKCAWCGQPIVDSSITYEGKIYHKTCYLQHVALYCTLCGGLIEGKYLTTFRGGAWHEYHKGQAPECDFCTAFIDKGKPGTYLRLDDGRYLCGTCMMTAITSNEMLTPLAQEVGGSLEAIRIRVDLHELVFHLVGKDVMSQLGDHAGVHRFQGV
jgi:ribosomal protein L24E